MILHLQKISNAVLQAYIKKMLRCVFPDHARSYLKKIFKIRDRKLEPNLIVNCEFVVERHSRICRILHETVLEFRINCTGDACEIGSGDCLASTDLLLSMGFQKVFLVEPTIPRIDKTQQEILRTIASDSRLPNSLLILPADFPKEDYPSNVQHIASFLENAIMKEKVDFVFSFDVLEHVADLCAFFRKSSEILKSGCFAIHKFDLSGHGILEDPIPPLDFQTYPDWLYHVIFPGPGRAQRNPLVSFKEALENNGFEIVDIKILRKADDEYIDSIKALMRRPLQNLPNHDIAPLDIIIVARRL